MCLSGLDNAEVQPTAEAIAASLASSIGTDAEILGPAPATILRIARRDRWQILLKFPLEVGGAIAHLKSLRSLCSQSVSMSLDVDPVTMD
jgi:primosomal protein N' (replication factor Y)